MPATTASSRTAPSDDAPVNDGLTPVSALAAQSLAGGMLDIFVRANPHAPPVLYRSWKLKRSTQAIETSELLFFIRVVDCKEFCDQLHAKLDRLLVDESIQAPHRMALLQEATSFEVEQAFSMIHGDRVTRLSKRMGKQIAGLLHRSKTLPRDLFGVVRHDFYTFTHVTNVASYAVLLAERLGIHDENELEAIATGGFLHDMGKRLISREILCKPSRLTDEERAIIQEHPQRGYEELRERGDLSFDQLMMVYQHHERIDGEGYPVRIMGEEIHPWARLCAVVDVFDALTGKRPYRRAASLGDAIGFLNQNAGTQFDEEMVQCWTLAMRSK